MMLINIFYHLSGFMQVYFVGYFLYCAVRMWRNTFVCIYTPWLATTSTYINRFW